MIVTTITRTYSKSFNTKQYGGADSWIKVESTYTAQLESSDDVAQISSSLHEQAKKEVVDAVTKVGDQIRAATAPTAPPQAPVMPPATGGPVPAPQTYQQPAQPAYYPPPAGGPRPL